MAVWKNIFKTKLLLSEKVPYSTTAPLPLALLRSVVLILWRITILPQLLQLLDSSSTAPRQLLDISSTAPRQLLDSSSTARGCQCRWAVQKVALQLLLHHTTTAPLQLLYSLRHIAKAFYSSYFTILRQLLYSSFTPPPPIGPNRVKRKKNVTKYICIYIYIYTYIYIYVMFHELGPGESPGALDQDVDNYIDWLRGFTPQKSARIVKIES